MDEQIKVEHIPKIEFTDEAIRQLTLMYENEYALKEMSLRISVDGKGCDGFKYSIGFSKLHQADILAQTNLPSSMPVVMDPFCAFYFASGRVHFVQNLVDEEEGFVVTNFDQENFKGKFWKKDSSRVP